MNSRHPLLFNVYLVQRGHSQRAVDIGKTVLHAPKGNSRTVLVNPYAIPAQMAQTALQVLIFVGLAKQEPYTTIPRVCNAPTVFTRTSWVAMKDQYVCPARTIRGATLFPVDAGCAPRSPQAAGGLAFRAAYALVDSNCQSSQTYHTVPDVLLDNMLHNFLTDACYALLDHSVGTALLQAVCLVPTVTPGLLRLAL